MEKILCITLMMGLLATSAHSAMSQEDAHSVCGELGKLSEVLVKARYANVSAMELVEFLNGMGAFGRSLVSEVFALPDYTTESMQVREAKLFGSRKYLECFEEVSK